MPDEVIVDDNTKEKVKEEEKQKDKTQEEAKIDYEKIARSKGWKPKDEFSGDAWVDAEEFVKREPLFDKIKQTKAEVKELKSVIENMTVHFKKAQDAAVQKAIADLKIQKKEAIETGDVAKVEQIDEQIEKQKQIKDDAPTKVEIRPEIKEWVSKNTWFDTKPKLQKFAISFNKTYAADNPDLSLSEVLEETEKAVKARFPEEFQEKVRRESSPVETPSSEVKVKGKGYGRDRLVSDAQRRVYDQVKRHGIFTDMTEYVKQLEDMGELD